MVKVGFNNFKAFGKKLQKFLYKPIILVYDSNSSGKSSFLYNLTLTLYEYIYQLYKLSQLCIFCFCCRLFPKRHVPFSFAFVKCAILSYFCYFDLQFF